MTVGKWDAQHRNEGGQVGPHTLTVSIAAEGGDTITVTRDVKTPTRPDYITRMTNQAAQAVAVAFGWPAGTENER